jgi:hypothetical protein
MDDPSFALQNDFNLTYAQLGLLPALYMAGLMMAAVIFNELTNHFNSFRLVGEHFIPSALCALREARGTSQEGPWQCRHLHAGY